LGPGAERVVAPFIEESRVFLARLSAVSEHTFQDGAE
jgi:hypothetical protein